MQTVYIPWSPERSHEWWSSDLVEIVEEMLNDKKLGDSLTRDGIFYQRAKKVCLDNILKLKVHLTAQELDYWRVHDKPMETMSPELQEIKPWALLRFEITNHHLLEKTLEFLDFGVDDKSKLEWVINTREGEEWARKQKFNKSRNSSYK